MWQSSLHSVMLMAIVALRDVKSKRWNIDKKNSIGINPMLMV